MGGAVVGEVAPEASAGEESNREDANLFEAFEYMRNPAAPASWKKFLREECTVPSVTAVSYI